MEPILFLSVLALKLFVGRLLNLYIFRGVVLLAHNVVTRMGTGDAYGNKKVSRSSSCARGILGLDRSFLAGVGDDDPTALDTVYCCVPNETNYF